MQVVLPTLLFSAQTMQKIVLEELGCQTIIVAEEVMPPTVAEFIAKNDLDCYRCPSVSYFLENVWTHLPCDRSYEEAADDVLAIMYTSGSTHDAKPIVWTNSFAASFLKQNIMEPPEGWENLDSTQHGTRLVNVLPPVLVSSHQLDSQIGSKTDYHLVRKFVQPFAHSSSDIDDYALSSAKVDCPCRDIP